MQEDTFITVVTGIPRSGTTLCMRMLFHGGMPVHAQSYLSFEHNDAGVAGGQEWGWLDNCYGKAVKLLEPLYREFPAGHRYKFILMQRDCTEQARSFLKFQKIVGGSDLTGGNAQAVIAKSFRDDMPKIHSALEKLGPVYLLRFEQVLSHPRQAAEHLRTFLGRDALDVDAMAAQVVRRDAACLPFMLEEILMDTKGLPPNQLILKEKHGGRPRC